MTEPRPESGGPSAPEGQSGDWTADYWARRSDLLYYRYVDLIVRTVGAQATSLIDVGSGNCPYLEWFDWIPDRVSVDIRAPYRSETVTGIAGDIHALDFGRRFDVCTCLQVLEHVPEAGPFARRLMELAELVVVSVPFKWGDKPEPTPGHVHDPVDRRSLRRWFGRAPNYQIVVTEPFLRHKNRRLIALYHADPERRFGPALRRDRVMRQF